MTGPFLCHVRIQQTLYTVQCLVPSRIPSTFPESGLQRVPCQPRASCFSPTESVLWLWKCAWQCQGANTPKTNRTTRDCFLAHQWDNLKRIPHSLSAGPQQDWAPDPQNHFSSLSHASWIHHWLNCMYLLLVSASAKAQGRCSCHYLSWPAALAVVRCRRWDWISFDSKIQLRKTVVGKRGSWNVWIVIE